MKKIVLVLILTCGFSGVAMAGLVYDFGLGYHTSIYESENFVGSEGNSGGVDGILDAFDLPFGMGVYGNFGWGFGGSNLFSLRLEGTLSLDMGEVASNFALANSNQVRLVALLRPLPIFSISAFVGNGHANLSTFKDEMRSANGWLVGGRVRVFFVFLDYSVMFDWRSGKTGPHEVLLGISLFGWDE